MWECRNCQERIEDRYKHCWNCGNPRPDAPKSSAPVRIHLKSPPSEEKTSLPPISETADLTPKEETAPKEETTPVEETPPAPPRAENREAEEPALFGSAFPYREKPPSKIGKIAPLFFWLAAVAAVAGFAYYSNQKTKAFEDRLAEDARRLSGQTNQFAFAPNAPRERQGFVKAKVLPLDAKSRQLDRLYYSLPDDLRPSTLEEVRTILWLDCSLKEVWRYDDGAPGFRESCNAYLTDRETSKIINSEEFPGEMPPLTKNPGNAETAPGKVAPPVYVAFIRSNQPETERAPLALASDSPAHHYLFKSELVYALVLLGLLGAIGIGWIVYQIKSALWKAV